MEEKHRLTAAERWLGERSVKAGFRLRSLRGDGYRQQEFTKSGGPLA
jgi:hypothetical protein